MGYRYFGYRSGYAPVSRGWRKQVLATGLISTDSRKNYLTFEEFCTEQRIRVQARLRPPIKEDDGVHFHEQGQHPLARLNDGFTRATLMRDADVEMRGRV